ncbi:MAG: TlpA family protein disulfide reductase [Spirochaetales bacterium]|nr:TlpA family protein disulfide reductase [Spirochaetales bacterium]
MANHRRLSHPLIQLTFFLLIVSGLHLFQTRDLLDSRQSAPPFELEDLQGRKVSLSDFSGKKTVLYFMAPWCSICKISFPALQALGQAAGGNIHVVAIALSYQNPGEVADFAGDVSFPVLLGKDSTGQDYRITAFPTLYVINADGQIASRSLGLATTAFMTVEGLAAF